MRCSYAPSALQGLIQVSADFFILFLCFIYKHLNIHDICGPFMHLSQARARDPMPFAPGADQRAWPGAARARSGSQTASADIVSCHYFNIPLT
jgi:hypothetical protein